VSSCKGGRVEIAGMWPGSRLTELAEQVGLLLSGGASLGKPTSVPKTKCIAQRGSHVAES
jgi:hypothetical protein